MGLEWVCMITVGITRQTPALWDRREVAAKVERIEEDWTDADFSS